MYLTILNENDGQRGKYLVLLGGVLANGREVLELVGGSGLDGAATLGPVGGADLAVLLL